jgi:hypothetical protein
MPNYGLSNPDGFPFHLIKLLPLKYSRFMDMLFKLSYQSGSVPAPWKTGFVVPIFKKGDRSDPANYRPVSITSPCCKVLEHIIVDYMNSFLSLNNVITPSQHGFRKFHSCESQLTNLTQELSSTLDNSGQTDAIFLDFSKAFDKVSHPLLLSKLNSMGFTDLVIGWIKNFLSERQQCIKLGDHLSSFKPVSSGVPQGSVLGPILFSIFINDLPDNIRSNTRLFADDCVLTRQVNSISDCALLQHDLSAVENWCSTWSMSMNADKCKIVSFTKKTNPLNFDYSLCGHTLERTKEYKYLGLIVADNLSWSKHIDHVTKKAMKALYFVRRQFWQSGIEVKKLLCSSLVRSHLEYAAVAWDPHLKNNIKALEMVQRRAVRFVFNNYHYKSSVTRMLTITEWPLLKSRRQIARLKAMFLAYCNTGGWSALNPYLLEPRYFSRNDHPYKLRCKPIKNNSGLNSFVYRTVNDWNSLPSSVFDPFPSSPSVFKHRLQRLFMPV